MEALKLFATENKIEAIFAFSQGSLLSIMLSILIEFDCEYKKLFKDLKCVIICAGFFDPFPTNKELSEYKDKIKHCLYTNKTNESNKANNDEHNCNNVKSFDNESNQSDLITITVPVLNVFGETDEFIKPEKSKQIEKLFKNVQSFNHAGKHFIPSSKADIEKYVEFLEKYLYV